MSRDGSGNYTLPVGNPVVSGTIIDVNWANPTMADIAQQLNNVITRDGVLGPLVPIGAVNGTQALPGMSFKLAPGTGLWREAAKAGYSYNGVAAWYKDSTGLVVPSNITVNSVNTGPLAGFRNQIINGGMQIAQRGNVAAVNGVFTYGGADRICTSVNALTLGTIQQITSGVSIGVSGFSHAVNATTSAAGAVLFETRIEAKDAIKLNGKVVTVSCRVYQDTGSNLDFNLVLLKPTTTADTFSAETTIQSSTATSVPSAVLTPIAFTFTVLGASAASLGLAARVVCTMGSAVTSKYFTITDWQLEIGSVATPFEFRPYSVELALCQRYYYRITPGASGGVFGFGQIASTTIANIFCQFPVQMRVAPTALEQSGILSDYSVNASAVTTVCNAVPTFGQATANAAIVAFATAATLTAGQAIRGQNSSGVTTAYLGWSAEL